MYFKYNKFRLSIDHLNLDKMTTLSGNYPPCRYHPKINISLQSLKYKAKHVSVNFWASCKHQSLSNKRNNKTVLHKG